MMRRRLADLLMCVACALIDIAARLDPVALPPLTEEGGGENHA